MNVTLAASIIFVIFCGIVLFGGASQLRKHNRDQNTPERITWGAGVFVIVAVMSVVVFAGWNFSQAAGALGQRMFTGGDAPQMPGFDSGVFGGGVDAPQPSRTR